MAAKIRRGPLGPSCCDVCGDPMSSRTFTIELYGSEGETRRTVDYCEPCGAYQIDGRRFGVSRESRAARAALEKYEGADFWRGTRIKKYAVT